MRGICHLPTGGLIETLRVDETRGVSERAEEKTDKDRILDSYLIKGLGREISDDNKLTNSYIIVLTVS